jgi:nucleotide-binding universal stress UspA family protein
LALPALIEPSANRSAGSFSRPLGRNGRSVIAIPRERVLAAAERATYPVRMPYRHVLVVCDGSSEGYEAVRAASELAVRDDAQLTVAAVVELEGTSRCFGSGRTTWNDVLLDAAASDLERARPLVRTPADFTVLIGPMATASAEAEREYGCDLIVVGERPRRWLGRALRRDRAKALRRRTNCPVMPL